MSTENADVTDSPTDVVAGKSLSAGSYIVQNRGSSDVFISFQDAALADPASITGDHVIGSREFIGMTVAGNNAAYLWCSDGLVGRVAITEDD